MTTELIVVTDLDGTLLDHHSYSWSPALPALERLEKCHIPVILNSSKTAAELEQIRKRLHNLEPFIVENGAAVYFPQPGGGYRQKVVGMNRADIISAAGRLRRQHGYQFTGFADMTAEELAGYTGLGKEDAGLALRREYTEPLLWQDSDERMHEFLELLEPAGITSVRGGRFLHLSGAADKGRAIDCLKRYYGGTSGRFPRVIALGDSENDRAMLECADYPVLIKSPVKDFPRWSIPNLIRTRAEGPTGWNEAVMQLLDGLICKEGDNAGEKQQ